MGGIDVPVRAAIGDCQIRLAGAPGDAEHDMFAKPCLAAHQPAVGLAVEPGSVAACVRIAPGAEPLAPEGKRSEEHTSELQSLMRISYAVFCLKKKNTIYTTTLCQDHSTT